MPTTGAVKLKQGDWYKIKRNHMGKGGAPIIKISRIRAGRVFVLDFSVRDGCLMPWTVGEREFGTLAETRRTLGSKWRAYNVTEERKR